MQCRFPVAAGISHRKSALHPAGCGGILGRHAQYRAWRRAGDGCMHEEPGATTIYGLIASDRREILVVPSAERWSLPRLPEAEASEVASALFEALGLETTLLGRI